MDTNQISDEGNALEAKRLRILRAYHIVVWGIIQRIYPIIAIVFVAAFVFILFVVWQASRFSSERFSAKSRLLYYPKQSAAYKQVDIKLVLELFSRYSLRNEVATRLNLSREERSSLPNRIEVELFKKNQNLIMLSCSADAPKKAIDLTNAVSEVVIDEYVAFRNDSLKGKLSEFEKQKAVYHSDLEKSNVEMRKLRHPSSWGTPEQELERVRSIITDNYAQITDLNLKIANEEQVYAKYKVLMKTVDRNAIANRKELGDFNREEQRLLGELDVLRQRFTDNNPKVLTAVQDLRNLIKRREDFIKEKKIFNYNLNYMAKAETIATNYENSELELSTLRQRLEICQRELERNQRVAGAIVVSLNAYSDLLRQRQTQLAAIKKVDDDIANINTMIASSSQELKVLDPAFNASPKSGMNTLKIAVSAFGAIFLTGILTVILVFLKIRNGNIQSAREVEFFADIDCIGEFPDLTEQTLSEKRMEEISHTLYYNLHRVVGNGHTLFRADLLGADSKHDINKMMGTDFALNGIRVFILFCKEFDSESENVAAGNSSDPLADELFGTVKHGDQGRFFINNINSLSPAEMAIFLQDMDTLLKHYDLVVIRRGKPLSGTELFFDQMSKYADSTLLNFGFGSTPRLLLREVAKITQDEQLNFCAILTGGKASE